MNEWVHAWWLSIPTVDIFFFKHLVISWDTYSRTGIPFLLSPLSHSSLSEVTGLPIACSQQRGHSHTFSPPMYWNHTHRVLTQAGSPTCCCWVITPRTEIPFNRDRYFHNLQSPRLDTVPLPSPSPLLLLTQHWDKNFLHSSLCLHQPYKYISIKETID